MGYYREEKVGAWTGLVNLLGSMGGDGWIFRGQKDSAWGLSSTLERAAPSGFLRPLYESRLKDSFRRRIHHFKSAESMVQSSLLELLALMQHYGVPTRLVDFTRSPFVAAFFAFEEPRLGSGDCAIWAIKASALQEAAVERMKIGGKPHPWGPLVGFGEDKIFEHFFGREKEFLVVPVDPLTNNLRQAHQQGIFICQSNIHRSLEDNLQECLGSDSTSIVVKIILPNSLRIVALDSLNKMNINTSTLFPGLEGYAKHIYREHEVFYAKVMKGKAKEEFDKND